MVGLGQRQDLDTRHRKSSGGLSLNADQGGAREQYQEGQGARNPRMGMSAQTARQPGQGRQHQSQGRKRRPTSAQHYARHAQGPSPAAA